MWTCWNFESIFLKIVHQMGLFDATKENPNVLSCRGILNIFRQWLLRTTTRDMVSFIDFYFHFSSKSSDLNFASYVFYIYQGYVTWHIQLALATYEYFQRGKLTAHFIVSNASKKPLRIWQTKSTVSFPLEDKHVVNEHHYVKS